MYQNAKKTLYTLLRKSERYTKTDMVYLAGGGFWSVLSQIVTSLSTLAVAIAFANLVPPDTYGTYKYILSIAGIFALFALPGLDQAVARAVARNEKGVLPSITHARIRYALVGSVAALLGGIYYFLNGNSELAIALWIISATLPFFDTFNLYLAHAIGIRRFDLHAGYTAAERVTSAVALVAALLLTNNILYILLAYFIPLILIRLLFYRRTITTIEKDAPAATVKNVLRYGKHLTAINILGVVSMQIDKILLWKLLGPVSVATYVFAIAIPDQMRGPLKGVSELAFAKFAKKSPEEISNSVPALWRKLALYAGALLGIAILYAVFAPFIYQLIFPQYLESVVYSQVIAFSLLGGVGSLAYRLFEAQQKTKVQYGISIIQHTVQILLYLILIPLYGIWGAIFALLIGRLFMVLQTLFTVRKVF